MKTYQEGDRDQNLERRWSDRDGRRKRKTDFGSKRARRRERDINEKSNTKGTRKGAYQL